MLAPHQRSTVSAKAINVELTSCNRRFPRLWTACHSLSNIPPYPIEHRDMPHTVREKTKLLSQVRRIRGQIEAIERALDAEIGCANVLQVIASVRGALNGLMAEVMEDHIRFHVVDPAREPNSARGQGAQELIDVVRTYLK